MRRSLAAAGCGLATAVLTLTGGPATAAPLEVPRDQKIQASCGPGKDQQIDLLAIPGPGVFTPYFDALGGRLLVPYEFRIDADAGLKARHLTLVGDGGEAVKVATKPGLSEEDAVTCTFLANAYDESGELREFSVTVVGMFVEAGQPSA